MRNRIAIVIDSLNGGGAERACLTLTQTLLDMGHDAHLIVLKKRCDYIPPKGMPIHFLESNASYRLHLSKNRKVLLRKFMSFLNLHDSFDLFIANLDESHHLLSNSQISNCLYVVHNSIEQSLKRSLKLGPIKYFRKLSAIKVLDKKHIICVSQGLKNEVSKHQKIKPLSLNCIYNPIDVQAIKKLAREDAPDSTLKPYCIHIGRFAKQKRHDLLFKAMQLDPSINMLLLARRSRKLEKMIKKFGLKDRVHIKDFVQNPYSLIKNSQALILCSDFEGFGLVISEALACNTPTVSTDCPHGPSEQLCGKLEKYLVKRNDPKKLISTLATAIENRSDFFEVDILKKFEPSNIAQQYLELIQEID